MSTPGDLRNTGLALGALFASSATLICCVLPAALVALGAGAALAGLVAAVPQLIWLSEHKSGVFGVAAALLAISGAAFGTAEASLARPIPILPAPAGSFGVSAL